VGLLGVCVGLYGLLDAGSPVALGLPVLLLGTVVAGVGLAVGGRRATRSRYRPDRWAGPEWLVAGSGLAAALAALVGAAADPAGMAPSTSPLVVPALPLVPVAGLLLALLPAWASPAPEEAEHDVDERPPARAVAA
jgi:energy-coupling factor transport system permease protein